jgi:hypothetical protein
LDIEHAVVADMHAGGRLSTDGAQSQREDVGMGLAHTDLIGERGVGKVRQQVVTVQKLAQDDARRSHRIRDDGQRVPTIA